MHKLLSEHQLSALLLIRFANGHAYQFTAGEVCSTTDLARPRIWKGIARELGRWHATLPVARALEPDETLRFVPGLWSTTQKWLDAIPNNPRYSKTDKAQLQEAFRYLVEKLLCNSTSPDHDLLVRQTPPPSESRVCTTSDGAFSFRFSRMVTCFVVTFWCRIPATRRRHPRQPRYDSSILSEYPHRSSPRRWM